MNEITAIGIAILGVTYLIYIKVCDAYDAIKDIRRNQRNEEKE